MVDIKNYRRGHHEDIKEYHIVFFTATGGEFSFPCTKAGHLKRKGLNSAAVENLRKIEAGEFCTVRRKFFDYSRTYYHSPQGKCCDQWMDLGSFINTCDICDADYDSNGSRLSDRQFWGEETGETLADILGPSSESDW